ncbi:hypothetical protein HG1285_17275 [Hydrogenivirga sp. 128-5-R1-1]|nr:hypothetical protein HG1285_17275 [Hydrogenivirga sp. 128-5-R1-1]
MRKRLGVINSLPLPPQEFLLARPGEPF